MRIHILKTGLVCTLFGLLTFACNKQEPVTPQSQLDIPPASGEQTVQVGYQGRYFTLPKPLTAAALKKVIPNADQLSILIKGTVYYYYDPQSSEGKQLAARYAPDEPAVTTNSTGASRQLLTPRATIYLYRKNPWATATNPFITKQVTSSGQSQLSHDTDNDASAIYLAHQDNSGNRHFRFTGYINRDFTGQSISIVAERGEGVRFIMSEDAPSFNNKMSSYTWGFLD